MASAGLHASPASAPAESDRRAASADRAAPSTRAPVLAVLLAAALTSRAISFGTEHLDQLWWLCHVATAAMVIGLAVGAPRIVAGAWLYHLVWGGPVWLLDVIVAGTTLPSSIAAHLGPLVLGGWWLTRRPWPGPVAVPAWMVGIAAMIVARPLTVPEHNVNAGHEVWPWLAAVFPSVAALWIITSLICLGFMVGVDTLFGRRARRGRR